jgi:hypothetical protein
MRKWPWRDGNLALMRSGIGVRRRVARAARYGGKGKAAACAVTAMPDVLEGSGLLDGDVMGVAKQATRRSA